MLGFHQDNVGIDESRRKFLLLGPFVCPDFSKYKRGGRGSGCGCNEILVVVVVVVVVLFDWGLLLLVLVRRRGAVVVLFHHAKNVLVDLY